MLQIKKETANIWEYKVGNNNNITNFVHLSKARMWKATYMYLF